MTPTPIPLGESEIMSDIGQIAVVAAADAMKRGEFDDAIEAVIVENVRKGPDEKLTRVGFVLKMAVEMMDRSNPSLSFKAAKRLALAAYQEFRRDNGSVKFGDKDWDWSGSAARLIAREYEINHWEPVP